jgi:hypothetical protein
VVQLEKIALSVRSDSQASDGILTPHKLPIIKGVISSKYPRKIILQDRKESLIKV